MAVDEINGNLGQVLFARDELASLSAEFHARTGKSWSEWADAARESFNRAALEAHEASLRTEEAHASPSR